MSSFIYKSDQYGSGKADSHHVSQADPFSFCELQNSVNDTAVKLASAAHSGPIRGQPPRSHHRSPTAPRLCQRSRGLAGRPAPCLGERSHGMLGLVVPSPPLPCTEQLGGGGRQNYNSQRQEGRALSPPGERRAVPLGRAAWAGLLAAYRSPAELVCLRPGISGREDEPGADGNHRSGLGGASPWRSRGQGEARAERAAGSGPAARALSVPAGARSGSRLPPGRRGAA